MTHPGCQRFNPLPSNPQYIDEDILHPWFIWVHATVVFKVTPYSYYMNFHRLTPYYVRENFHRFSSQPVESVFLTPCATVEFVDKLPSTILILQVVHISNISI